jgi:hypothetical protein
MVYKHVVEQSAQRNDDDLLPALVNAIPVTGVAPEDISATVFWAFVGRSRNSTGSCMRPDVDTNLHYTPSPMWPGWVANSAARHGVGQMFRHCGLVDDFAEKLS